MRTEITWRQLKNWPTDRERTPVDARRDGPFKAKYNTLRRDLDDELFRVGARETTVELDVQTQAAFSRVNGEPLVDMRMRSPAVVLRYVNEAGTLLTFACDRFHLWTDNLRAISLTLHDLRRIERYETTAKGQQYSGWAQLPASTGSTLSTEEAAQFLAQHAKGITAREMLDSPTMARDALRQVQNKLHPQNGGRSGDFAQATDAGRTLAAHHGLAKL
jgi:hypothetical protein